MKPGADIKIRTAERQSVRFVSESVSESGYPNQNRF